MATTIDAARTQTRQVTRKLRGLEALDPEESERLLGTDEGIGAPLEAEAP